MIVSYQTYCDVTGDTFTPQARVEANLVRAQAKVEDRAERAFELAERTESLPVVDGKAWPKAYPITSVSLPSGAAVSADGLSLMLSPSNWLSDPVMADAAGLTPADPTHYLFTYVGGYAPGAVPVDLVDIICEVAQRYSLPANTAAVPAGATSINVNGQGISGGVLGGASALTPALKASIARYKHVNARMG